MLKFQQPPKEYSDVFLEDTDRPLPEVLNSNTRYMFLHTIAKGGKCLINAVRDMHLSRVVVYKTLRPEFVGDEIEETRLLREARVSAMLQHPNTAPVYEIGRDNHKHYYFTMKLVHGYTLREVLDYRERYDLSQLVEVIEQIAQALAYAHSHGVAHRDIKPENILIGPYGEVLLLDWGLAKVWSKDGSSTDETNHKEQSVAHSDSTMTGHGQVQGSPLYMSPEQINRDPEIGFGTDLYSLGAVLYETLTGQTPFDSDITHELIEAVKHDEPPRPSDISKYRIPKSLEELSLKCLQKDSANRPASMNDFIKVLSEDWMSEILNR